MRTTPRLWAAAVCAAFMTGCADGSTSPEGAGERERRTTSPTGAPFVVSDPALVGAAGANPSGAAAPVVYVSLPPGSVPTGVRATVRNLATRSEASVAIVAGGFDPVAVAASVGDTLAIDVTVSSGNAPPSLFTVVPRARPPTVVRTNPPPRKRQVPLNSTIEIVFSEPVDPSTVTGATVRLRTGDTFVSGAIASADPARLTFTFAPTEPLVGETDYELVVTADVRDLDGEPLEAAVSVTFTTSVGGVLAFVSDRDGVAHIYIGNVDGSGVRRLTNTPEAEGRPAWSPDGRWIAFSRGGDPDVRGIYVINTDGSGFTRLTDAEGDVDPAWSPDGTRIAFGRRGPLAPAARYIMTMNADGSGIAVLHDGGELAIGPTWSPDGTRIAFESVAGSIGDVPQQIYLMRADGTGARRLTAPFNGGEFAEGRPAWSPDGALIAFWSFGFGVAVMNADGTGTPRSLTGDTFPRDQPLELSTWYFASPTWSPSGRVVAFVKSRGVSSTAGPFAIDITALDGSLGTGVELPLGGLGPRGDFDPAWSPVRR